MLILEVVETITALFWPYITQVLQVIIVRRVFISKLQDMKKVGQIRDIEFKLSYC